MKKTIQFLCIVCAFVSLNLKSADSAIIPLITQKNNHVIDGIIQKDEWNNSTVFSGFLRYQPRQLITDREGSVFLCADKDNFYIAIKTVTPNHDIGGGLLTRSKKHDSEVFNDDSIEVAIVPDTNDSKGYHLIANSNDVIFDRMFDYANKASVLSWNCSGLETKSNIQSGWWTIELKIPRIAIGNPQNGIKLNIARNWSGIGPSALSSTRDHMEQSRMLDIKWRHDAIPVQLNDLGPIAEGIWIPKVEFPLLPSKKTACLDIIIRKHKIPGDDGKIVMSLAKTITHTCIVSKKYMDIERELNSLQIFVRDTSNGEVLFKRTFSAQKGSTPGNIPPTLEFDIKGIGTGQCFYYPSKNFADINLSCYRDLKVKSLTVLIGNQETLMNKKSGEYYASIQIQKKPGIYPVQFKMQLENKAEAETLYGFSLEKKTFPWENNSLGKAKIILPPFKPIHIDKNELSIIMRKVVLNGSGLFSSLECLHQQMLAAPLYYKLVVNGKTYILQGKTPEIKTENNGYNAKIEACAVSEEGTRLITNGNFEYDGFLWNQIKLFNIAGKKLEGLTVVIPLLNQECPLYHIVTADSIRHNPSGNVPSGEGLIWSGDKLYRPLVSGILTIHPQFVPYIWLGAEKRGFSFFIDNSCGMKLDEKKPAVRLFREKKVLRLEIDLINRAVQVKEGHAFAFGMQPTPIKPVPKKLKEYFQTNFSQGIDSQKTLLMINSRLIGNLNEWSKKPYKNDWSLCDAVAKTLKEGQNPDRVATAIQKWDRNNHEQLIPLLADLPHVDGREYYTWWQDCRRYSLADLCKIKKPAFFGKYSDPTLAFYKNEAVQYFRTEWISSPCGYTGAIRAFLVPSFMDYVLYYYDQQMAHGLQGVYFDDMFLISCHNPRTLAQTDDKGYVHATMGILAMRELVKRAAVMQYERGLSPRWLQIHMTNALLVPCFSFATSILDWESYFGELEFQKRFSLAYVRTESLGTQIGAESVVLDGNVRKSTPKETWQNSRLEYLTRTQLAMMLPNGIKPWLRMPVTAGFHRPTVYRAYDILGKFQIWSNDCRFVPWFEDDGLIGSAPKGVLLSSYRHSKETLIVIGNMDDSEKHFKLSLNRQKLGLSATAQIYNAETTDLLEKNMVTLPKYDFVILIVTEDKPEIPTLQQQP